MKASITVFSALILSVIVILNCVLVDSARLISARADLQRKTSLAADSILAGFDSVLRDSYKIFAIDGKKDLKDEFLSYMGRGYSIKEVDIGLDGPLTQGDVLQGQILEEMGGQVPLSLFESLLDKLDILKDGDRKSDLYKHEVEVTLIISEIDANIDDLYHYVEGYYKGDSFCVNGYDPFNKHLSYLSILKAYIGFLEGEGTNKEDLIGEVRDALLKIRMDANSYLFYNTKALEEINILQMMKSQADIKIKEMEAILKAYQPNDSNDILNKERLEGQIANLKSRLSYMSNQHLLKPISTNINIFTRINKGVDGLLGQIEKDLQDLDLKEIRTYIEDLDNKGLCLDLRVKKEKRSSDTSFLAFDKREEAEDVLGQLFAKKEKKTIGADMYKSLPSVKNNMDKNEAFDKISSGFALNSVNVLTSLFSIKDMIKDLKDRPGEYMLENFCVDQYILSFFNNSVNINNFRGAFFRSEVEYIIGGTSDEGLNDLICKTIIFGIRFNLNFLYLLTDSDKMDLANSIGNSIAASISLGIGGPLYAILILVSWAIFESSLDINELAKGEGVPFIKSKNTWKSSIEGLLTEELIEEEPSLKLTYEDYLRIILTFTPKETKLMRICDLIDLNISSFSNTRYYTAYMYTDIRINLKAKVKSLSAHLLYKKEESFDLEVKAFASY